jgi:hypothetical protein
MKALISTFLSRLGKYSFRLFFCNDKLIEPPQEWLLPSKGAGDRYFYLEQKWDNERRNGHRGEVDCKPLFSLVKIVASSTKTPPAEFSTTDQASACGLSE